MAAVGSGRFRKSGHLLLTRLTWAVGMMVKVGPLFAVLCTRGMLRPEMGGQGAPVMAAAAAAAGRKCKFGAQYLLLLLLLLL
jgi:hypothetical protein